jgi:hypothetical protein
MENSEPKSISSSFCKICAGNGFPNERLYWKRVEREDGSIGWLPPFQDPECTIRHTHKQPEAMSITEEKVPVAVGPNREVLEGDRLEALPKGEIAQMLLEVHDLSQKQNGLLKNLLERLGYLR